MTDVTEFKYWLDIAVKTAIGAALALVSYDYKGVKTSLRDLERAKYQTTAEVSIISSRLERIEAKLDRLDGKIDRALK